MIRLLNLFFSTVAITICMTSALHADLIFNFVETASGDTLAVLKLTELPADETSVQSLEFTAAGQLVLGLSPTYGGQFDFVGAATGPAGLGNILSDGSGGLTGYGPIFGDAGLTDLDPDQSTLQANAGTDSLELSFQPTQDFITLRPININFDPSIQIAGQFVSVPEPSSLLIVGLGMAALIGKRRRAQIGT